MNYRISERQRNSFNNVHTKIFVNTEIGESQKGDNSMSARRYKKKKSSLVSDSSCSLIFDVIYLTIYIYNFKGFSPIRGKLRTKLQKPTPRLATVITDKSFLVRGSQSFRFQFKQKYRLTKIL